MNGNSDKNTKKATTTVKKTVIKEEPVKAETVTKKAAKPAAPKTAEKPIAVKNTGKQNMTKKDESKEAAEKPHDQLGFYTEVYKQAEQGVEGMVAILPYVENKALKNLLQGQQKSYETLAVELKTKISAMGGSAEKPNIFEKMMVKGGTMMGTIADRSESRLAELVMKGANMGVIALTRLLNECQGEQVDVMHGNKLMSLYERQLDVLKSYL